MYIPDYQTLKFEHQERIDRAQAANLAASMSRNRRMAKRAERAATRRVRSHQPRARRGLPRLSLLRRLIKPA